jgi:ankyrin repeat protein
LLVDNHANVNQADAQRFTPLFWAVDRRNFETAPNFPWMVTADPLPLVQKLLDAGANPNALVNNTPRARMREGSPRIVYSTALMRAAFAGDLTLVKLLVSRGADPHIASRDNETPPMAAAVPLMDVPVFCISSPRFIMPPALPMPPSIAPRMPLPWDSMPDSGRPDFIPDPVLPDSIDPPIVESFVSDPVSVEGAPFGSAPLFEVLERGFFLGPPICNLLLAR